MKPRGAIWARRWSNSKRGPGRDADVARAALARRARVGDAACSQQRGARGRRGYAAGAAARKSAAAAADRREPRHRARPAQGSLAGRARRRARVPRQRGESRGPANAAGSRSPAFMSRPLASRSGPAARPLDPARDAVLRFLTRSQGLIVAARQSASRARCGGSRREAADDREPPARLGHAAPLRSAAGRGERARSDDRRLRERGVHARRGGGDGRGRACRRGFRHRGRGGAVRARPSFRSSPSATCSRAGDGRSRRNASSRSSAARERGHARGGATAARLRARWSGEPASCPRDESPRQPSSPRSQARRVNSRRRIVDGRRPA